MRTFKFSFVAASALLLISTTSATRRSVAVVGPVLSVSPTALVFATTVVGDFAYGIVTVTNSGDAADYISTATADPNPPFFPTFAGTCNTSVDGNGQNYYIPAGTSCTFQWGFHPSRAGRVNGSATLSFQSGATLTIDLTGMGKPNLP
jgi:hypothetical protein